MRLPEMSNPISSSASSHPPHHHLTTTGLCVQRLSITELPVTDKFLGPAELHQPTDPNNIKSLNVADQLVDFTSADHLNTAFATGPPTNMAHPNLNPLQLPSTLARTEPAPKDPLGLVIAKRKKKELADPQIAEAILCASKLPPPEIPDVLTSTDLPDELVHIRAMNLEREKEDLRNADFFRNYSLKLGKHQMMAQSKPVEPLTPKRKPNRSRAFARKYLYPRDRRKPGGGGAGQGDDDDSDGDGSDRMAEPTRGLLKSTVHSDEDWFMESFLHFFCILLIIITMPLSLIFCLKVVTHYERAVLFRLGRLVSATAKGPGLIFVLPCLDRYRILDLRTFTFDVPTQEVLTKDSVTVVVNAVVYYRVRDPVRAVVNVEDANRATRVLGQTTLRNVLGTVNLDELLTAREDIAALMQECLDSVTEVWGVKVERVEIKDVRLPIQLQRAMAAEAESVREATAKVIAAEGEMHASGALKAAAFEISQHPIAMQLRYLQAINSISSGKQSTIVFPVPLDLSSLFKSQHDHLLCDLVSSESLLLTDPNPEEPGAGPGLTEAARSVLLDCQNSLFQDDPVESLAQIV